MRICMVTFSLEEFGGLEEFAKNLAIGLHQKGHQISVLSTAWVPSDNQYLRSFKENNIRYTQLPKWISLPASYRPTKDKILSILLLLSIPFILLLGIPVSIFRRRSFFKSVTSAHNWLRGQYRRFMLPDWRKPFSILLLSWWKFYWKPDVYHLHGYTSNLLFVIDWAHRRNLPVVYQEHQTPDAQFDWWKDFKTTINKANIVVGVSEISAAALREVCGVTIPIKVIYYLVPDPMDGTGKSSISYNRSNKDYLKVSTFARLYVTKGLTYLLDAIAKIKQQHPDTQFSVYGEGPLREELLKYASQLGLDGAKIFVGAFTSRDELPAIMANTDIYVMSSILEGLPVSIIEAMSYGLPIVATPVGGIPEAIQNGVNGLLCEPGNAECLAKKITCLIEDPELREKLGAAARNSYEHGPFHPSAVCDQFIAAYHEAMNGKVNSL